MKNSRSSEIFQELLVKIVQEELKAGETLPPVETFAEKYGVSRTVMREVYLALATRNLVKSVPRRGTIIQTADHWDWWDKNILIAAVQNNGNTSKVKEVNQYRLMTEPSVCEQAAITATKADVELIRQSLEKLKTSTKSLKEWAEADVKFHESILHAAHNDLMIQMGKSLSKPFYFSRLKVKNEDFLKNLTFNYQEQIIQAIQLKQPSLARQLMLHLILTQIEN